MANYMMELRGIVGSRPLLVTGSAVIIIDGEGRILLQKRGDNGRWAFPGGAMELGESFEDTARREVFEETGLTVGELKLLTLESGSHTFYEYPNGHQCYFAVAVFKTTDFKGEMRADNHESLDVRFFCFNKLPQNLVPQERNILIKFFQ